MKSFFSLVVLAMSISCTSINQNSSLLSEAVDGPLRSEDFKKRDIYRHPKETLTFFGIKPDMTVIEIWPSGGWYTEILAPYLSANGKYIIADPPTDPRGYTTRRTEWLNKNKKIASTVSFTKFSPSASTQIGEANSADMVLTFRNVHNWQPSSSQEAAFISFFRVLKPGGILGVVEHRAHKSKKLDPKSGYVSEAEVIRLALKAGFKLAASSEINANPMDTKDYPEGVWTLPPALRLGEKNRAQYLEIGESDRMTLKFLKPQ